jgi:hypothetical protein
LPVCALNEDGELVDASEMLQKMEIGETYYWKAYVTLEDGQYYESSVQSFAL